MTKPSERLQYLKAILMMTRERSKIGMTKCVKVAFILLFLLVLTAIYVFVRAPASTDNASLTARKGVIYVERFISEEMPIFEADAIMQKLVSSGAKHWIFPCYTIRLSQTVRFSGSGLKLEGCGGASLLEMHDVPAFESDGQHQKRNADGSLRFVNSGDDFFVFGMDPQGNTTSDITITDLHLNRDGDATGGAGLKIGQGALVYIERVSSTNFFHDFEVLGGVAVHFTKVYSNTGNHFPFFRTGSADLLVTPYLAPGSKTVHTGSGVYVNDSEFASNEKVSAGYEIEGVDTTMVVNSYFGGETCQIRIDAARVEGGTNSQTIMFDNVYLDGGSTPTTGLCVPVNRNGWNAKTKSFDGSHYGPAQMRFANGTSQSHLGYDVKIEEPSTDRIGLFNNNFGNNGKGGSLFVRGHSAQISGNNVVASGRAFDVEADMLLLTQNTLASVADCRLPSVIPGSAAHIATPFNVDDGGCRHP